MAEMDTNRNSPAGEALLLEGNGLRLVLQRVGDSLAVGSLLPADCAGFQPPEEGLEYCRETEILLTGEGCDFPARSRSLGGCGSKLVFQGLEERPADAGRLRVLRYERADLGLRVRSFYHFAPDGVPVVRRWVEVENAGPEAVGLERVASSVLYHLGRQSEGELVEKMRLHIPFSSWSGEGQWRTLGLRELGVDVEDSSHYRATCLGSRSSAEKAPMAVLEDTAGEVCWFWQIEHSGSWKWEIGHLFLGAPHGMYLLAGGPDEDHGHWWKNLRPGETFSSVPVAIGCVRGGFGEAVRELTRYRRAACRPPHPVDDALPVIFNDYMNGIWGDPTLEKEIPLVEAAAQAGCEVFCMDSGYYAAPGESWWPNVGHWEIDPDRFPGDDFSRLMQLVRERGMVPGIWIEAEVCGIRNRLAARPDDWFLMRHGKRILYNRRYFWNFRNPEVLAHLDAVIDRFVREYGIGYIKNDYNIDLHCGTDTRADSLGDGLLEHIRAFYRWIDGVRARHPRLIWENCAAGGLRVDYGILSRAQLQSSSDQATCDRYAPVAIGSSALVLPEQLAVWAYPHENDLEKTVLNMVNALLFRVHYAGRPDLLDAENRILVEEALAYYKATRHRVARSVPFYPMGMAGLSDGNGWLALGMRDAEGVRIAVWRRAANEAVCRIPLEGLPPVARVRCAYPSAPELRTEAKLCGGTLEVRLDAPFGARLFELDFQGLEGRAVLP